MRNAAYWQRRIETLEDATYRVAAATATQMEGLVMQAQRELENQIAGWYVRFAENNQIDLADAKLRLTANQLAEFRWDVNQYIAHAKANTIDQRWTRQLENASARVHITRLQALQVQTQQTIERLFGNQLDMMDSLLKRQFLDRYYKMMFEVQRGLGVGWDFAGVDERRLNALMNKPWTTDGRSFSNRIWGDKDRLIAELHKTLTQSLITGQNPNELVAEFASKMNTTKNNAARLIRTESAAVAAVADKEVYDELNITKYRILATLDKKTSDICQKMDGKLFRKSEYEVGITAPPLHPNCRSATVPHFDDNFGERIARDNDGKTYHVPHDMTYPEWRRRYAS